MSATDSASQDRPAVTTPITELLLEYDRVLNQAEHLPTIVWIRTRPAGCSVLSRWWRLPRLTVGTSLFVLRHIGRSTEALLRLHASP